MREGGNLAALTNDLIHFELTCVRCEQPKEFVACGMINGYPIWGTLLPTAFWADRRLLAFGGESAKAAFRCGYPDAVRPLGRGAPGGQSGSIRLDTPPLSAFQMN